MEIDGEVVEEHEFMSFCRLCLTRPEPDGLLDRDIIYDIEDHLTYSNCLALCADIDLDKEEGWPNNICKMCGMELQMAYDFRKKAKNATEQLKKLWAMGHNSIDSDTAQIETIYEIENASLEEIDKDTGTSQLDEDHYDVIEQLDIESVESLDDDGETIQLQIERKSTDNEYQVVVSLTKEQHSELKHKGPNNSISESVDETTSVYDKDCSQSHDSEYTDPEEEQSKPKKCGKRSRKRHANATAVAHNEKNRKRYLGKFSCDQCGKEFNHHSRMVVHRQLHNPDRPKFPCTQCNRIYATKQALEVHTRSIHARTGYTCGFCGKIYAIKKSLEVHMRYHTGDFPYTCEKCGKSFAQKCHLNTHYNVKHNSTRFYCTYENCGKYFTSSASLRNHEFSHGSMPFECAFCHKGYPAKSKLKVHIKTAHGQNLSLEEMEPMRKFYVMRSKLHLVKLVTDEDEYKDDDVDVSTTPATAKTEITDHWEVASVPDAEELTGVDAEEEAKADSVANDSNISKRNDASEVVIMYESDKDAADSVCDFGELYTEEEEEAEDMAIEQNSANSSEAPKRHRTRVSITGPPFKCEQCDHISPSRALLASHRHRKHRLKENPARCPKCDKAFDTRKQLERHLKRPTCQAYPEFICEYCDKKCIGVSNYNIHVRFHKKQYPFVCHLCAKRFMMAVHLTDHVKVKHENQRFICPFEDCGKLFQTRHSMKSHAYIHTNSMPYLCEYCDRMFPSKGRLRWHIKKTHDVKLTLADLDRMCVAEELSINAQLVKIDPPGPGNSP